MRKVSDLEISEDVWKECRDVEKREVVLEVSEKFWNDIEEEKKFREKERRRKYFVWRKERDEIWRSKEEGRILEMLRKIRKENMKEWFRDYLERNGRRLFEVYSRVMLVNEDNWCYDFKVKGVRRDNGKVELVKLERKRIGKERLIKMLEKKGEFYDLEKIGDEWLDSKWFRKSIGEL